MTLANISPRNRLRKEMNKSSDLIIDYIENGIHKIILNRPLKKNALTQPMYNTLTKIIEDSKYNDRVQMLVLTGSGDFYSSGNDFVSAFENSSDSQDLETALNNVKRWVDSIIKCPKLLVALVNGPAVGIAATTLALFDIVYASDTTYLWTPFSKLGLVGEGCSTHTFPRILGPSKAGEVLYFGHKLTAYEGEKHHLFSKVYQHGQEKEVWKHLEKLSSLSKQSILSTKRLVKQWDQQVLLKVNEEEFKELKKIQSSPEFIENIIKLMNQQTKL